MPVPDLPSFYIIIHTMPPLLSLTIFCMVSCSLDWLSSPMEVSLLRMPSCTSCSMDFPNIFVSQMLSPRCPLSPIYWIRSFACCSVPTIGAISVSMLALIMWIEGLLHYHTVAAFSHRLQRRLHFDVLFFHCREFFHRMDQIIFCFHLDTAHFT